MSLSLASLFQDNAVIQRGKMIPVWGWANPGSRVKATISGQSAECITNQSGDFILRLPEIHQQGPHDLIVEVVDTGERLQVKNLAVGEVWLASGQSNMEWSLSSSLPLTEEDIATADYPDIRFFNVKTRAHLGSHRTVDGTWQSASPEIAGTFSAVAYSFARKLHRVLNVPIGIISSSWGGSIIQSWMSRSALAMAPNTAEWLASYEQQAWTAERWAKMNTTGPDGRVSALPTDPGNTGIAKGWHLDDFNDSDWSSIRLPSTWQSAGHLHSGIYWYRRTFEIPAAWVGKDLELHLGAIDKQDITYVNRVEVGRTGNGLEEAYWATPRVYTVPAKLTLQKNLTIAVRVFSFIFDGGMTGPEESMYLKLAGESANIKSLAGDWHYRCEHNLGHISERHISGHGERNSPYMLFDNMVHPLAPFPLRGVLWYQGENNENDGEIYANLMRTLIHDWRWLWGDPALAFHLVQLPRFKAPKALQIDSPWARIREAQCEVLSEPHTGIAVTVDLGEASDIHPKNKIPVGERLAQSALALEYKAASIPCGPIFDQMTIQGESIRCSFRHSSPCLNTSDGLPPRLFFVAGKDRIFYPAEAQIQKDEIVVRSPNVLNPAAVRYAWADNPESCNLVGPGGLPASPFRSDKWQIAS